ncbi:MAG: DUF1800 family protein [Myxococcota bacterium]
MNAHLALNRFGLGARPGQAAALTDPKRWLLDQVKAPPSPLPHEAALPSTHEVARRLFAAKGQDRMAMRDLAGALHRADVQAWWTSLALTQTPFFHRWLAFFSNHFTVSAAKRQVMPLWGAFQRDALRPNVLGRFGDLMLAVAQHPAMLLYLDNVRSVGPSSRAARGARGLNENLAREILELHTLGVNGGYTQADIIALAKIITGWSVPRNAEQLISGTFRFSARAHEPGTKMLLGQGTPQGRAAGEAAIRSLGTHPSTAAHLCRKLAVHFVADDPPPALVKALVRAWTESQGNLASVAKTLIEHPASWTPQTGKLKTPQDLVVSAARAVEAHDGAAMHKASSKLGQNVARAPSPAGWDDVATAWLGPQNMLGRVDLAVKVANQARGQVTDPLAFGIDLVGDTLSPSERAQIGAAPARRGLILFLASPAFHRR